MAGAFKHTLAVKRDGTLWAWGANASVQLGFVGVELQLTPAQVGVAVP